MRYLIDAWLENGIPQLRITDADTGAVRLRWARAGPAAPDGGDETGEHEACRALHRLFKDLVLLSCADKVDLAELAKSPALGNDCRDCDLCVTPYQQTSHPDTADNVVSLTEWRQTLKPRRS